MAYTEHKWEGRAGGSSAPTGAAGGDLSGTYPNPTVATLEGTTVASLIALVLAGGVSATLANGTGLDGSFDLDGINTYTQFSLSGSTYSVAATYILNAQNLTVRTGITVDMRGAPLFVAGLLTTEGTCSIGNNGGASAATAGSAAGVGAPPAAANSRTANNMYMGGWPGGPGHVANSNGDAAQALSNAIWLGGAGGAGGSGINNTTATTRTGGAGGSGLSSTKWAPHYNGAFNQIIWNGAAIGPAGRYQLVGGTGGGSGGTAIGSGGTGSTGGGGGGGVVGVFAARGNFSAGTSITVNGGSAGHHPGTGSNNGGTGGSGGGGGGALLFMVGNVESATLPTFSAAGGNGGNGGFVGTNTLGNGGNGGDGGRIAILVGGYAGPAPTVSVAGGTAGAGSGSGSASGTNGAAGVYSYSLVS